MLEKLIVDKLEQELTRKVELDHQIPSQPVEPVGR